MKYRPWYNENADYQTNAKSYMDYLGRVNKFMKVLMEDYEVFQELILEEFRLFSLDNSQTIEEFQERLDGIKQEMVDFFVEWLEDGTLEQIINHDVLGNKADKSFVDSEIERVDQFVDSEIERLDQKDENIITQLEQTEEKVFYDSPVSSKSKRKLVAWIDDDGSSAFYDYFKGLYQEFGIVFNSAIVGSWIGNPVTRMTVAQMHELQDLGFGFPSHSYTHDTNNRLGDMSETELHQEMKLARKAMRENGLKSDVIVYPFGSNSVLSRNVVRQYFKAGIDTRTVKSGDNPGGYNPSPFNQFAMQRINVHEGNIRTFPIIEKASQENEPLILMSHINQSGWLSDTEIRQLIQKLLGLGYEFVTIDELIMKTGNGAQFGETTISGDGIIGGTDLGRLKMLGLHRLEQPIDYYEKGKITSFKVNLQAIEEFRVPTAGRIFVYREDEEYFNYRIFVGAQENIMLYSRWDTVNQVWADWQYFYSNTVGGNLYVNTTTSILNVVKLSWDDLPTIPLAKTFVLQGASGNLGNAVIMKAENGTGVALVTHRLGTVNMEYDGSTWTETPVES